MDVLIVESDIELAYFWKQCLETFRLKIAVAHTQSDAIKRILDTGYKTIILNLVIEEGCAFAISDFASYRRPGARVIFVTDTSFFSDGSIFRHSSNACALVQRDTPPADLAAMVQHYAHDCA